ncbi:MAG TPA: hypothetical protein VGB59_03450 [Allosphingosinicella sp.]|jgi:hypothetical protein
MSLPPHRYRIVFLLSLAATLSSCDSQSAPAEAPPAPLPAEVCRQVKGGLEKLADTAGLVFNDVGEMTIERQVWLAFPETKRAQMARILAIHASCVGGGKSREIDVTVRDESGTVLMGQLVKTSSEIEDALGSDEAR